MRSCITVLIAQPTGEDAFTSASLLVKKEGRPLEAAPRNFSVAWFPAPSISYALTAAFFSAIAFGMETR